ncbi:MAG: MarR family transcriptional regulator [Candidatus Omnitrophica bacterium]|nr:MarR family transcriptional regulator [Candidatus Omnitrophota bacterium]
MRNLSLSEFAERISEIMPVISRRFYKKVTGEFFRMKVTMSQFVILEILSRDGESRMTDLARGIGVSTAAITGMADRLVRDGYAVRVSDPGDRRIIKVDLTSKGSKLVKKMRDHRKQIVSKIFGVLSEAEREKYLELLLTIRDRLKE